MMVKSLSRKAPDFAGMLLYAANEGKAVGLPLLHNFPPPPDGGFSLPAIQAIFEDNAAHCPPRKNGAYLYHEILSLAPDDAPQATPEALSDLGRHYLTRRAPGALAYGVVHADRANLHLHLVIAANLIGQAKKLRLSRSDFGAVKRHLENYQREHYPELRHSLVFRDGPLPQNGRAVEAAGEGMVRSPDEFERAKRLAQQPRREPSRKERLRSLLLNALTVCDTPAEFQTFLGEQDLTLYHRGGRPYGLIAEGKKYRFTTLDLESHFERALEGWQQVPAFERAVQNSAAERLRQEWRRETGYAAEIVEALYAPDSAAPMHGREEQHPHTEINAAIRAHRSRRRERYLHGQARNR